MNASEARHLVQYIRKILRRKGGEQTVRSWGDETLVFHSHGNRH